MTGRAALASAQEDPPDLVVLDVMLPDLDGLGVTRHSRADGIRVPILFLTARYSVEDKVASLTVGGDDYNDQAVLARGDRRAQAAQSAAPARREQRHD